MTLLFRSNELMYRLNLPLDISALVRITNYIDFFRFSTVRDCLYYETPSNK